MRRARKIAIRKITLKNSFPFNETRSEPENWLLFGEIAMFGERSMMSCESEMSLECSLMGECMLFSLSDVRSEYTV